MFCVFVEKDVSEAEFRNFLYDLFPAMKFRIITPTALEFNEGVTIVTIEDFTRVYRRRIEFYLEEKKNGIAFTQFVGEKLSLAFGCDTVTEVEAEGHPFDQYNALLIKGEQKYVINDEGIEFEDYQPKVKYEWLKKVERFDKGGKIITSKL